MVVINDNISQDLLAQRAFLKKLENENFDFGLTVAAAFVRGMRDVGYKDSGRALDELIDNSIQGEATKVLVTFGFSKGSDAKPTSIAVVDNGHGMDPKMVRLSAIWGGTHRENDRHGFGRYGYGLPSACVSQGQRFTVYSKTQGSVIHSVTLDLDDISDGRLTKNNRIVVPEATPTTLPAWLAQEIVERFGAGGFEHGTVVLIEKLDKLKPKTKAALSTHLLQGIGVTYRNFLRGTTMWVGDKKVDPIDPLFITPGYRFYEIDGDPDKAEPLEPLSFPVTEPETRREQGNIRVRFSSMPPTFGRKDKSRDAQGQNRNARFKVLDEHNGLIVMREGRQIDVITRGGWLTVNNDDRYWGVEVDIPATLDEEMSITTSKQRAILSDRIWDLLEQHGVKASIASLRKRYDEEKKTASTAQETDSAGERHSEQAMAASEKFEPQRAPETPERRRRSQEGFEREVERRTAASGVPAEQVKALLEKETAERPYRVKTESLPGAPFFRMDQIGGQQVLYINTAHRFYGDVYAGPDSSPRMRSSLDIVLFAIGAGELNADGDLLTFYETERGRWSSRLHTALSQFANIDAPTEDRAED